MNHNLFKIVLVFLVISIFLPKEVLAQPKNYRTPDYTKIYGNQIENLENLEPGEPGVKQLKFNSIANNFDENHNGFMVRYEPTKVRDNNNNILLRLSLGVNNNILEIFYENSLTLKLRRYYHKDKSKFIDYTLFDKMLDYPDRFPVFKFYFAQNFIWIEQHDSSLSFGDKAFHSSLFWGIDVVGSSNINSFLQKSSEATLTLFEPFISQEFTAEDISIYGFKVEDLVQEITTNFSRASESARNTENLITDDENSNRISKEGLIELSGEEQNQEVVIYPNPVRAGDRVFIKFNENLSLSENNSIIYKIYPSSGQAKPVQEGFIDSQNGIKLSSRLKAGLYILIYNYKGISKNRKLLITN